MCHGEERMEKMDQRDASLPHSMTTFFRHFQNRRFPQRAPTIPKHHRYRRDWFRQENKSTEDLLDKVNIMKMLLTRRNRENEDAPANTTSGKLVDRVVDKMNKVVHEANLTKKNCNLSGRWLSEAAGGLFELSLPDTGAIRNIPVKHKAVNDKVHVGFMNGIDWDTSIMFPFSASDQYIILTAVNKRFMIIATFVGECRISHRHEVVQGSWLIISHSRDCESLGATTKLLGDDWRKDNLEELRACHLPAIQQKIKTSDKCPQNICVQCPVGNPTASPLKHEGEEGIILTPGKNKATKPPTASPLLIRLH